MALILSCAQRGTVVATVYPDRASADEDAATIQVMAPLANSVVAAGFPCLVVQPFEEPASFSSPPVAFLPAPTPPLLPRSRFCNSSSEYTNRRVQLHRMRMLRILLDQHLNVLSIDVNHILLRNPLPAIHALRTRHGDAPDVLGSTPGWFMKHFYLSTNMYIKSTAATRALLSAAEPRVRGAHEDVVFSEELNWGAGMQASCCHTDCLSKQTQANGAAVRSKSPSQASKVPTRALIDTDRIETPLGTPRLASNAAACNAAGRRFDDMPPLAPLPPNKTSNGWPRSADGSIATHGVRRYGKSAKGLPLMQLAWRNDSYNTLHVPLHRFGRCTGRTESCVGLHEHCPPPPPPFDVVLARKAAGRSVKRRRSTKGRR